VVTRSSPWRLGPELPGLTAEWLRGWLGAAAEQRPGLRLDAYREARRAGLRGATVGHVDLLAVFD